VNKTEEYFRELDRSVWPSCGESCGGCGSKVFNVAFCGECFGKLPGRLKRILHGPVASPAYQGAVDEAKGVLKILKDGC
jgi:hypothetical protein